MSLKVEGAYCIACNEIAVVKSCRERYGIVDFYPACHKHNGMDDLNFWKVVKNKSADCPCCLCVSARAVGA